MQLPQQFLDSLNGIKGFDREAFVQVHESGEQVTSVRFNPLKLSMVNSEWSKKSGESTTGNQPLIHPARPPVPVRTGMTPARMIRSGGRLDGHSPLPIADSRLPIAAPVPWSSYGYYLSERPPFTFDPLLHAGVYYVQEASGMFLEQALKQTVDITKPLRVLDLCAAPGGKSTLLQSLISNESILVSNEVIKSRASVLEENCTKWGGANVVVTNNDPQDFSRLENFFDVIVIDAPCSGSGLFRREPEAINEWSEQHVQLCSRRQQRILADVYPALKQDGILIYCTCSYSKEEDEELLDWMAKEMAVSSCRLAIDESWNITEVKSDKNNCYGYRFFPGKLKGEGFFLGCFQKKDGKEANFKGSKKSSLQPVVKNEIAVMQPWIKKEIPLQFRKHSDRIIAFPVAVEKELLTIVDNLYVRRAGITIGKIAGAELIPHHALAVSTIAGDETVVISLNKTEALQYLRKEDVKVAIAHKGWALVQFEGINLGWIKIMPNRINNYYPKEWRILKSDSN